MFVCLCPFCAQVVLQASFMCCVVEVLFDVLFDVVLPTLCSSMQVACFFHVDVVKFFHLLLLDAVLFCAVLKAGCMFLSCAEMLVLEPAQLIIYSHAGTLSI